METRTQPSAPLVDPASRKSLRFLSLVSPFVFFLYIFQAFSFLKVLKLNVQATVAHSFLFL